MRGGQARQEQIERAPGEGVFLGKGAHHHLLHGIRHGPVEKISLFLVPIGRGSPHPLTNRQDAVRRGAAILLQERLNTVDDREGCAEILIGL